MSKTDESNNRNREPEPDKEREKQNKPEESGKNLSEPGKTDERNENLSEPGKTDERNENLSEPGKTDERNENPAETGDTRRKRMLTEPVERLLLANAVPTMAGMLAATVYNMTDTFWIGRLGDTAMTAAIGIVYALVSILQAVGFWFGYGSGNVMSRKLGAKDTGEAEIISADGILLSVLTGIILMILGLVFLEPLTILSGGGASTELRIYSEEYLRIILFSAPFSLFATTVYNQLRLCGNVKDGMKGLMAGMLCNIILDPILILGLEMGIEGAGLATLVGQILSAILLYFISGRNGNIPVRFRGFDFGEKRLAEILAGGAPNFARQGISGLATAFLNSMAAPYGEALIASLTVAGKIPAIFYMLMIGFGQGFQPICAMNYGAKEYERVKKAFRLTVTIGTVFLCISIIPLLIWAVPLAGLLSENGEVIAAASLMIRLQCISFPVLSFYAVSSMYMQNMGKYRQSLTISVLRQGIIYIPMILILKAALGSFGFYLLQPVSDLLSFAVTAVIVNRYRVR